MRVTQPDEVRTLPFDFETKMAPGDALLDLTKIGLIYTGGIEAVSKTFLG